METINALCRKILTHEESRDLFLPSVQQGNIQVTDWYIVDYEPTNLLYVKDVNGDLHQIEGETTSHLKYVTNSTIIGLYNLAINGDLQARENIYEILDLARTGELPTLNSVIKFGLDEHIPTHLPKNSTNKVTDYYIRENKLLYKIEGRPIIHTIPLDKKEVSIEKKLRLLNQIRVLQSSPPKDLEK